MSNSGFGALEGREYSIFVSRALGAPTTDFQPCCAARRSGGGAMLIGGQTLLFDDLARWVESRALPEHLGNKIEGVKASDTNAEKLVAATPLGLRVETTGATWNAQHEALELPAGEHNISFSLRGQSVPKPAADVVNGDAARAAAGVQLTLINCATGEETASLVVSIESNATTPADEYSFHRATLPALPAGFYVLHAALSGIEQELPWPLDYKAVSGEKDWKPARYKWVHPIYGVAYYDPRFNEDGVGAIPYDRADPIQAALLDEHERLAADGLLKEQASWASQVMRFKSDGTQSTRGGEYSSLLLALGGASAPSQFHPDCTATHLWEEDASGKLQPRCLEPRIRKIGALQLIDGELWATGMMGDADGRRTFLYKLGDDLQVLSRFYAPREANASGESVELVQSNDPAGVGLALVNDARGAHIEVLTHQAKYVLEPLTGELLRVSNGGRALAVAKRRDGHDLSTHVGVGDDKNDNLLQFPDSAEQFAVVAAVDGALAASTRIFGIVPDLGEEEGNLSAQNAEKLDDDTQALVKFLQGAPQTIINWPRSRAEYSRLLMAGTSLLGFGFNRFGVPRLLRVRGELAQLHWNCEYAATWTGEGVSADGKNRVGFLIGKRLAGARALPGWYIAETSGELQTAVFEWDNAEQEFMLL